MIIVDDDETDYDTKRDIDIINLWTDFCKGFAKFIVKD